MMRILFFLFFLFSCNLQKDKKANISISPFDTTFNALNWKMGNLYMRGRMVNDLLKSNILKSISKDSLITLLGQPSEDGNDLCTYLVSNRDTSIVHNYLLVYISIDSTSKEINDYWISD